MGSRVKQTQNGWELGGRILETRLTGFGTCLDRGDEKEVGMN